MNKEEFLAKFISDAEFREEFKSDPKGVMLAAGLNVPEGAELEVVESTPAKHYIVLPPLQTGELSEEDVSSVDGGTAHMFVGQNDAGYTIMTHAPYC